MSGVYSQVPNAGNPQSVQSQVVLNADFDRFYCRYASANATRPSQDARFVPDHLKTEQDPNLYNIMPRELAFSIRYNFDPKLQRPGNGLSRDMRIFTTANHMPVLMDLKDVLPKSGRSDPDKRRFLEAKSIDILRTQITFVGVPLTKVLYDENLRQSGNDKVPVQISGSTTIWNTGPYDIHPGDKVLWDIPQGTRDGALGPLSTRQVPGLPSNKRLFWTVPLRDALSSTLNLGGGDLSVENLIDSIHPKTQPANAAHTSRVTSDDSFSVLVKEFEKNIGSKNMSTIPPNGSAGDVDGTRANLAQMLYVWNLEWQSYTNRVIGIALKGASPGQAFDIMIQRA